MKKYLDPKADLTFKKIFGRHPDLLISLLNALLPLGDDEQIESVEYLPTELVPELYEHKNSIVDVLCKDIHGRQFCVEMQMEWTASFKQRVLFNASKLYVSQAQKAEHYSDLKPVYSLNLVNDYIDRNNPIYIHNYKIVHDRHSDNIIKGLHFTFIELPKFTPHSIPEKRMAVLWLRFLTEITGNTKEVPAELLENPDINKALEEVEVSAFTENELRAYDKFWDTVRTEKSLLYDSEQKGLAEGRVQGLAEGRAKGLVEGRAKGLAEGKIEEKKATAKRAIAAGLSPKQAAVISDMTIEDVLELVQNG